MCPCIFDNLIFIRLRVEKCYGRVASNDKRSPAHAKKSALPYFFSFLCTFKVSHRGDSGHVGYLQIDSLVYPVVSLLGNSCTLGVKTNLPLNNSDTQTRGDHCGAGGILSNAGAVRYS
ncbi:hypothetical protein TRVL_09435 [Trypanosoma vivax]|nr:hypothetical protein TRVL_09435 [Trypanosoma vivax]